MKKTPLFTPIRAFAAGCLVVLATGPAVADFVKTKDGKVWSGTIVAEDSTSVTIRTAVVGKIMDNKVIPRSDITEVKKQTPDELAADEVKKLLPTEDFLRPSDYTSMIQDGPAAFLAKYPNSRFRAEVEAVKKTLEEERALTQRSQRKVEGKWLSGVEMQAQAYNVEGLRNFRELQKLAEADQYRHALLKFTELEAAGKLSTSYPKAIAVAKEVAEKYAAWLAQEVKNIPQKTKLAADSLSKMTPDEKRAALAEREKRRKDFQAQLAQEKKDKVKFSSVMETDAVSLNNAAKEVENELKRLQTLDVASITKTAEEYDKILKLEGQQKYEEAALRLEDFIKNNKLASAEPAVKDHQVRLKKLREEAIRASQQQELLNRTQAKPQ